MAACKTCKHLDVKPDAAGRRRVYDDKGYRCTVPNPSKPSLPLCMTEHHGFPWPRPRTFVIPSWTGCPFHEELA